MNLQILAQPALPARRRSICALPRKHANMRPDPTSGLRILKNSVRTHRPASPSFAVKHATQAESRALGSAPLQDFGFSWPAHPGLRCAPPWAFVARRFAAILLIFAVSTEPAFNLHFAIFNLQSSPFGKGLALQPGQLLDQFARGLFSGTWNSEGIPVKN
jgi:hypothetical protein